MANYNFGMGLINGLQQGIDAYIQADEKKKDRSERLGLLRAEKGLIPDGQGGYKKDPEFQKVTDQEAIKAAALKGEVLQRDPTTGLLTNIGLNDSKKAQELEIQGAKAIATQKATAPERQTDNETELRKEWQTDPTTKATKDVSSAYAKMQQASKKASAAGDMSLIYGFMKMQDPGSTVREGEYASAEQARGVSDSVLNLYNKAKDGVRLTDAQRADFLNQAQGMHEAQMGRQEEFNKMYEDIARRKGYSPNNVVMRGIFGNIQYPKKTQTPQASQGSGLIQPRTPVRKQQNKAANKTRITYSDGSVEELDGLQ